MRLQANREFAQTVACRALKSEDLGSTPTGDNILLLDIFFSRDSVESTECISIYNGGLDDRIFHPSVVDHDVLSTKMHLLGINQRSKSHGDMLQDGSSSPSQQ